MSESALADTQSGAICHFLRLPTELRLEIYRYMLRVDRPHHPDRLCQYDQRQPAILRTDRLIYSEAIAVLYSEVRIVPGSGYIFRPRSGRDHNYSTTWKHQPLGDNNVGIHDRTVNEVSDFKPRYPYPDILPRFQHIVLDVRIQYTAAIWHLKAEKPTINIQDRKKLAASFLRSSKTANLVHLLAQSPNIRTLTLKLTTNVRPCYERCPDMETDESVLDGSSDSNPDCEVFERSVRRANEVTAEAFLLSGALDPLARLCNVENFDVTFDVWRKSKYEAVFETVALGERCFLRPGYYARVAQNLKDVIERNWRLAQGLEREDDIEVERRALVREVFGVELSRSGALCW